MADLVTLHRFAVMVKRLQGTKTVSYSGRALRIVEGSRKLDFRVVSCAAETELSQRMDAVSKKEVGSRVNCVTKEELLKVNGITVIRDQFEHLLH
jgi:hypothetical protein